MDEKGQKVLKIILYISIMTAVIGGIATSILFKGPAFIGAFFGVILGFFLPWAVALMSYTVYAMSNPAVAFKDEIDKLNKR